MVIQTLSGLKRTDCAVANCTGMQLPYNRDTKEQREKPVYKLLLDVVKSLT